MTTYKEISGKYVRSVSSDPPTALGTGEIWYNTSSNVFKQLVKYFLGLVVQTYLGVRWNTSGAGTQTAGLVFGGSTGPSLGTFLNTTFEYNGSSWTSSPTTPISSINMFSAGTQTTAIGGGGLASSGSNSNSSVYI